MEVLLEHDYCGAPGNSGGSQSQLENGDEMGFTVDMDVCDEIVVSPVRTYSISEDVDNTGNVRKPVSEGWGLSASVDVDVCDEIVVNPVRTYSMSEDSFSVSSAQIEKHQYMKAGETNWDGEAADLKVGLTFESRELVKEFIIRYGKRNFSNMVVAEGGLSKNSKSRKVNIYCLF